MELRSDFHSWFFSLPYLLQNEIRRVNRVYHLDAEVSWREGRIRLIYQESKLEMSAWIKHWNLLPQRMCWHDRADFHEKKIPCLTFQMNKKTTRGYIFLWSRVPQAAQHSHQLPSSWKGSCANMFKKAHALWINLPLLFLPTKAFI